MERLTKDDRCPSCRKYRQCGLPRLAFLTFNVDPNDFCCNSYERLR